MRVGVGYSENPDTAAAGLEAAREALARATTEVAAGENAGPCDMILLFATARHDARILRDAVSAILGEGIPILGGGAVGAIANDRFGYAGDQIILAAVWMEKTSCAILTESGLAESEKACGERLGEKLKQIGTGPESPVMLFYDAIDRRDGSLRLLMATRLLAGMEKSLGFLPALTGAGLQGDYTCTPARQWLGLGPENKSGESIIGEHHALALAFGGEVRIDSVIMHGCHPATGYYTITKADRQTILEINGQPAIEFLDSLLGPEIRPEQYPFFLILGVNSGDRWGEFDENNYANRLCLGLDTDRGGIVMFEPDMVAGTEFQIMYRSMDTSYMAPRIEELFTNLKGRKPVFAMYIDCAGRAAGYAGMDLEDAPVVQKTVNERVPLLGIYTGVEIASVAGKPRGLDWTGVFCLFSVPE